MENFFSSGVLFWFLVFILRNMEKPSDSPEYNSKQPACADSSHSFEVAYYSNGRLLDDSLFFYYYDMLNLRGKDKVDYQVIISSAEKRYALINKIDYNDEQRPVASRDVKAAQGYITDRWTYVAFLN